MTFALPTPGLYDSRNQIWSSVNGRQELHQLSQLSGPQHVFESLLP